MKDQGLTLCLQGAPAPLGLLTPREADPQALAGKGEEEAVGPVDLEEAGQGGAGGAAEGNAFPGGAEGGGVQGEEEAPPEGQAI